MPAITKHNSPRHWLCVAQSFPPVNRSGTFRTLAFVRHLDRAGWQATVVTADASDAAIDDSLAELIPASASIVPARCVDVLQALKHWHRRIRLRAHAQPKAHSVTAAAPTPQAGLLRGATDVITQLLCTPDSRLGWIPSAVKAALRTLRERPAEVLYSTSPCMSAHLIALLIKRWTGIPWIADFRDPWRDNGFRRCGVRIVNRWDAFLEACVLRHADRIVCNTPTACAELCRRKPRIARKCGTISNGIDFDLLAGVMPSRSEPPDCFVLTHCGQFYGPRSPRPWFRALGQLRLAEPAIGAKLRFLSVGCEAYDGEPLARIAQQEGVADLVRIFPRVSHHESLAMAAGADVVMVAGSAGAGAHLQVPNKLYEYLGLRKPMVVALDERSPAHEILRAARARATACTPGDPDTIARAIREIIQRPRDPDADWSGVSRFDRAHRAAELREAFEDLVELALAGRVGQTASFPVAGLTPLPIVRPGSRTPPLPSRRAATAAGDRGGFPDWARSECSMPL